MAKQTINLGTSANDGTGDSLRNAMDKINDNFDELYANGTAGSNISVTTNVIASTNSNGNIEIDPAGTGKVVIASDILPDSGNARYLGSSSTRFRGAYIGGLTINSVGDISTDGNITANNISYTGESFVGDLVGSVFGDDSTIIIDGINSSVSADTGTFGSITSGNILPSANVTYNIGSPTAQWKEMYVSANTIYLDGTPLSVSGNVLSVGGSNVAIDGSVSYTVTTADVEAHEGNLELSTSQITSGTFANARISSDSVVQHQANLTITESQISDLSHTTETNDLTSSVTWTTVPDAYISSSSVTQHQANLTITESQISDLGHSTYGDSDVASYLLTNTANIAAGNVIATFIGDVTGNLTGNVTGTVSDISGDTSPQLGGNLDTNGKNISFGDSATPGTDDTLTFGASNDLRIYHNGVSSIVEDAGTGGLTLRGNNVYLQDDSSGGYGLFAQGLHNGAFEIYYDNSKKLATTNTGIEFTGNVTASNFVGNVTGNLTGTASAYNVTTADVEAHEGNLTITESQISDLGSYITGYTVTSGDVTAHQGNITAVGTLTGVTTSGNITGVDTADNTAPTSYTIRAGKNTSSDLFNSAAGGSLTIQGGSSLQATGGAVTINGGSGGVGGTINIGTSNTAVVNVGTEMKFGDWDGVSNKDSALFGAGSDLRIYHDGTDSWITDNNTGGTLNIATNQLDILGGNDGAETMATFVDNGAVTLYYDNSAKIATTSAGVTVTGNVTASNFVGNLTGTASAYDVTTADVEAHEGNLTITESQISDLGTYLTSVSGSITVDDITTNEVYETLTSKSSATGTVAHDLSTGHIFYHTSISADFTANFTNIDTTANLATTATLVLVQGATAYLPTAVQIGGSAETINWQGGSQPTGTNNGIDVVTFSILDVSGTYTVLGQLTDF